MLVGSGNNRQLSHVMYHASDKSPKIDQTLLNNFIREIEEDLKNGSWYDKIYAKLDLKLMPNLIEKANAKKEGLNLHFLNTPFELSEFLVEFNQQSAESIRFVVNLGQMGLHFAFLDCRKLDNKISVILFDSADFSSLAGGLLFLQTKIAIEKTGLENINYCGIILDIQKSHSECGMFSLAFAKKTHKLYKEFSLLHEYHLLGKLKLCEGNYAKGGAVEHFLPPEFFKHTQGTTRLKEYLEHNLIAAEKIVNKKGQTLIQRHQDGLERIKDKLMSKSIHNKRLVEYQQLVDGNNGGK